MINQRINWLSEISFSSLFLGLVCLPTYLWIQYLIMGAGLKKHFFRVKKKKFCLLEEILRKFSMMLGIQIFATTMNYKISILNNWLIFTIKKQFFSFQEHQCYTEWRCSHVSWLFSFSEIYLILKSFLRIIFVLILAVLTILKIVLYLKIYFHVSSDENIMSKSILEHPRRRKMKKVHIMILWWAKAGARPKS